MKINKIILYKLILLSFMLNFLEIKGINIGNKICFSILTFFIFILEKKVKVNKLVLLFIFSMSISAILSQNKMLSLLYLLNYMLQIIFFMTLLNLKVDDYLSIFKFIINFSFIISIFGILQYIFYPNLENLLLLFKTTLYEGRRATSIFNNPNLLSTFLIGSVILSSFLYEYKKDRKILLCMIVNILCLFLTKSRTGFFSIVIYLIFYFWDKNRKKKYLCIFIFIFLILITLKFNYHYFDRIEILYRSLIAKDYTILMSKRNIIYTIALDIYNLNIKNMLFGIGSGSFEKEILNYYPISFGIHSLYLGLLVENGIIVTVIFLLFLLQTLYNMRKIKIKMIRKSFTYLLIFLSISQITEMHLTHNYYFIYIYWIVLSVSHNNHIKKEKGKRKNEE